MAQHQPGGDPNYASSPTSYDPPTNSASTAFPPGPSFNSRPGINTSSSYTRRGLSSPSSSQPPQSSAFATISARLTQTGPTRHPLSLSRGEMSPIGARPGESLLPRRLPPRATRVLAVVVLVLVGWWALSGSSADSRHAGKATTRWWDPTSGGEWLVPWPWTLGLIWSQCAGPRPGADAQTRALALAAHSQSYFKL